MHSLWKLWKQRRLRSVSPSSASHIQILQLGATSPSRSWLFLKVWVGSSEICSGVSPGRACTSPSSSPKASNSWEQIQMVSGQDQYTGKVDSKSRKDLNLFYFIYISKNIIPQLSPIRYWWQIFVEFELMKICFHSGKCIWKLMHEMIMSGS